MKQRQGNYVRELSSRVLRYRLLARLVVISVIKESGVRICRGGGGLSWLGGGEVGRARGAVGRARPLAATYDRPTLPLRADFRVETIEMR